MPDSTKAASSFDPLLFRQQFPAIKSDEIYLDSAATALKPEPVISAILQYYQSCTSTVHRSQHASAQSTTELFEQARQLAAVYLHAENPQEIVWTKNTTEAINLIAQSYARPRLRSGDEILVSEAEHHSNLIPWLMVAEQTGAKVVKLPVDTNYLPDVSALHHYLTPKTQILALGQMSNVTGGRPNLQYAIQQAHQQNVIVVIDGAQGAVHHPLNVRALNIDFYAFSGHKLYGPTGVGVLYGKSALLSQMSPWQGGGKMLQHTSFEHFTLQPPPQRFEAGTPNVAGVLAMHALFTWLTQFDALAAENYAANLATLAEQKLSSLAGFQSYRADNSSLLAFNFDNIHPSDLSNLLAEQGVSLRSGQHCAQPLMQALGVSGTLRASFAPYNTVEEVEIFFQSVKRALQLLQE